ncbi:MAG: protoporphyrinogen oxidase [Nitrososphaerota archaeon]|nr:protoporphyrinogen oxidase [Nitrososphaerota archaeon]MDG6932315.1 protoporphyrinogen oxidase [Nitrososphaerota archaeon]MDG6936491.1 protoporphyrinogen oxidase [Nitrososphaerota archaeon]MDG6944643.1 protoporphyrinogen oxidase [Nitrososphaerota archaeon]
MLGNQKYDAVVIGGGISGLSASIKLAEAGRKILLLESQNELGGKIRTLSLTETLTEEGPDELITGYKKFDELLTRANVFDSLIYPETSRFYIYSRNRLRRFPESLITGIPSFNLNDIYNFVTSGLLSPKGYARAMLEPFFKINGLSDDLSIRALFEKKFGSEFTKNVIDPLFGGIMGADISIISSRSYVPYIYQVAKDGKSLSIYFSRKRGTRHFKITSTLNGLRGIVEMLRKYAEKNGVKIITGMAVKSVEYMNGNWNINTETDRIKCSRLIMAVPSYVASKLVRDIDKNLSFLLSSIKYSGITTANLVYKEASVRLHEKFSGFLVPSNSGFKLRGCTLMSRKWSYARMKDHELIRCFINRDPLKPEEYYTQSAAEELAQIGITEGYPEKSSVKVWDSALPVYAIGHSELIKKINETVPPNMYLAGAPYNGVGVASSGVSGIEAAEKIMSETEK